ncbi:siderophore-interacting protein [Kocuria sp.]|uniref:siderophore-interacting protein n=1 Tax=Kocuria sp. TaxID=1871328 RepID=UPI0026E05491|nr:siderophore-interacting protein [Kocuria sp.]MDO5618686.1 siderophore-interacting protein [Kocuria sp.]
MTTETATGTATSAGPQVVCAQVTVTGVQQLSPTFRRIRVAGPELANFSAQLVGSESSSPLTCSDAYVKLLVPPHGASPTRPNIAMGYRAWFAQPQEERGFLRTYTTRSARWIPWQGGTVPELTLDFVVHAQDHGPGSLWALNAVAGSTVFILGPGPNEPAWTSWGPGRARRIVAVGDETAAPALLSIVEELEATGTAERVDVILEVPTTADLPAVVGVADRGVRKAAAPVRVHALARAESGPHGTGSVRQLAHVLDLPTFCVADVLAGRRPGRVMTTPTPDPELMWEVADPEAERDTYVFLAGEAASVKAWRRLCVDAAGIPKSNVSFMGYWRRGQAES